MMAAWCCVVISRSHASPPPLPLVCSAAAFMNGQP